MAKPGRVGAPTALRLLRGDKKDRINFREPTVRDGELEAPDGISADVREIWDYTVRELVAMNCAATADRDALVCYCEAVAAHRKASAIVAKSPVLVQGLHGGMVRNPALQIQRDAAATVKGFAAEFGLTPSARANIVMDGKTQDGHTNPFAAHA
jgi:P27 family predicted phage terminase small subunit